MCRTSRIGLRVLVFLALSALSLLCCCSQTRAEEPAPEKIYEEQLDESGADELFSELPEETRKMLEGLGVTGLSPDAVYDLSLDGVFRLLGGLAGEAAGSAAKTGLCILGVILLAALMQTVQQPGSEETGKVFRAAEILLCALLVLDPLSRLMQSASAVLSTATAFQMSFVPVFAAVMAAGGQTVTAGKYTALAIGASQCSSGLLSAVILPLLRMCTALSVTVAAAPGIRLDSVLTFARKGLNLLLGLMMTVFLAVLSLQGAVSGAADSLADKAAQFLIGSAIPVVGGALSQAYSSVRGYLRLLKSTVGAFGILAVAVLLLPQLVTLLIWRLVLEGCAAVGELFEQKELTALLRNLSGLLGILLGVLLCGGLMMIVAIGVMLAVRGAA